MNLEAAMTFQLYGERENIEYTKGTRSEQVGLNVSTVRDMKLCVKIV
jgi:hypothetical protein